MTVENMPAAEVDINAPLVHALLSDQHPDLADLPLVEFTNGWDNVIYRLGHELLVRLPRRAMAAELVEHEQRWLPQLAPRLPLATPVPVRVGLPALGYPWSWSVCPWLDGKMLARQPPADMRAAAQALGAFVCAMHTDAPANAPVNPYRGVALAERAATVHDRLARLAGIVDTAALALRWEQLAATPPWTRPARWLHGDLHPGNILATHGVVTGVIDFGDICSGDPATDLSLAWILFDSPERGAFRAAAGDVDDETWERAKGWALALGLAYVAHSADAPLMAVVGNRALAAVLDD